MDELDRLILAAYPGLEKQKMLEYRQFSDNYGLGFVKKELRKVIDRRKQGRKERDEQIKRERQQRAYHAKIKKERKTAAKKAKPSRRIYLRNGMVPTPNCIVRSALFGIVKRGCRRRVEEYETLPSYGVNGWTIRWRGVRLDQADADVWFYLIRKACEISSDFLNGQELDLKTISVKFTRNGLLKAINRSKGGQNRKWLDQSITRLRDCDVQVEGPNGSPRESATLLGRRNEDDASDMEIVEIDVNLAKLLGNNLTLVDFQKRLSLGQDQLAKWLHGFLSSHKGPIYPVRITTLHALVASPLPIPVFRQRVESALNKISDVVEGYEVSGRGDSAVFKIKLAPKKRGRR
jgi:hypothetical protein